MRRKHIIDDNLQGNLLSLAAPIKEKAEYSPYNEENIGTYFELPWLLYMQKELNKAGLPTYVTTFDPLYYMVGKYVFNSHELMKWSIDALPDGVSLKDWFEEKFGDSADRYAFAFGICA